MDRPNLPQLDTILETVEQLRELEERKAALKATLDAHVKALETVGDRDARLQAAVYAYWLAPEVNANVLALAVTGKAHPSAMLKKAGAAVSIGVPCDRCGEDLEITSRTQLRDIERAVKETHYRLPEGYSVLCSSCREAVYAERSEEYERVQDEQDAQSRVLAQLSYRDYLATPDWAARRERAADFALYERHELACELCRQRDELSFVHQTFDLVGRDERIILLCRPCWTALAAADKLAVEPIAENRADRRELDRMEAAFLADRMPAPL
jgi:hypothetical protein